VNLVGAEIRKLTTVRSPWLVYAFGQVLVLAGVSGTLARGDTDRTAVRGAVGHIGLVAVVALVVGIFCVAGEYRHRTIADTYLTTPRRGRVVGAKLVVVLLAGVVFAVTSTVTAFAGTLAYLAVNGGSLDWGDPVLWRIVGGDVAWNVLFALLGASLGALVRNQTVAVTGALVWLALVESVVAQLAGGEVARWLPFAAGSALGALPTIGGDPLTQWSAGLVLVAYAAVFTTVALTVSTRRDLH
jgi:ABC-2 type transport system permease protein